MLGDIRVVFLRGELYVREKHHYQVNWRGSTLTSWRTGQAEEKE